MRHNTNTLTISPFEWDIQFQEGLTHGIRCLLSPCILICQSEFEEQTHKLDDRNCLFARFITYRSVRVVIFVSTMGNGPDNLFPFSTLHDFGINRSTTCCVILFYVMKWTLLCSTFICTISILIIWRCLAQGQILKNGGSSK